MVIPYGLVGGKKSNSFRKRGPSLALLPDEPFHISSNAALSPVDQSSQCTVSAEWIKTHK